MAGSRPTLRRLVLSADRACARPLHELLPCSVADVENVHFLLPLHDAVNHAIDMGFIAIEQVSQAWVLGRAGERRGLSRKLRMACLRPRYQVKAASEDRAPILR